jgi:hypothetical protein
MRNTFLLSRNVLPARHLYPAPHDRQDPNCVSDIYIGYTRKNITGSLPHSTPGDRLGINLIFYLIAVLSNSELAAQDVTEVLIYSKGAWVYKFWKVKETPHRNWELPIAGIAIAVKIARIAKPKLPDLCRTPQLGRL